LNISNVIKITGKLVGAGLSDRGRPMDNAQIDEELRAALYLLGFNFLGGDFLSGEIAEIKGNMTIKLGASARRGVEIRRRVAG
jgi:hypothetical protein